MMPRVIKNGMKWMPSFCNVLFFSTSKKLRRAFEEETAKRNFLVFCAGPKFQPHFSSLSLNNKSKKSLDRPLVWHDKNLILVRVLSHSSSFIKTWVTGRFFFFLFDFFLSVCLSVCCAQIYDSNESDRKRLNHRLSFTSSCRNCWRIVTGCDGNPLFWRDRDAGSFFSWCSWLLEFGISCLVFYTCSRECIKRTDEDI